MKVYFKFEKRLEEAMKTIRNIVIDEARETSYQMINLILEDVSVRFNKSYLEDTPYEHTLRLKDYLCNCKIEENIKSQNTDESTAKTSPSLDQYIPVKDIPWRSEIFDTKKYSAKSISNCLRHALCSMGNVRTKKVRVCYESSNSNAKINIDAYHIEDIARLKEKLEANPELLSKYRIKETT